VLQLGGGGGGGCGGGGGSSSSTNLALYKFLFVLFVL